MEKQPYEFDYQGACAPKQAYSANNTFSYGIFQWIPARNGKLKKGKAYIRVKGYSHDAANVKAKTEETVKRMNLLHGKMPYTPQRIEIINVKSI